MKRTVILALALVMAVPMRAHSAPSPLGSTGDSSACGSAWHITLGVSAGAKLISMGSSPYSSSQAVFVEVPLVGDIALSSSWTLTTGLKYRFEWAPLKYEVQTREGADGLYYNSTPGTVRHLATAQHSYVGIPVEVTWFPKPDNHRLLRMSMDVYAAYAVSRYIRSRTLDPMRLGLGGSDMLLDADDPTLLPWKLEVGLTVATDYLGLLHGLRFFVDLLPTYRDPATGHGVNTVGLAIYL